MVAFEQMGLKQQDTKASSLVHKVEFKQIIWLQSEPSKLKENVNYWEKFYM